MNRQAAEITFGNYFPPQHVQVPIKIDGEEYLFEQLDMKNKYHMAQTKKGFHFFFVPDWIDISDVIFDYALVHGISKEGAHN